MAADGRLLQGEVNDDQAGKAVDVEAMLIGFIRALSAEQGDTEEAKESR